MKIAYTQPPHLQIQLSVSFLASPATGQNQLAFPQRKQGPQTLLGLTRLMPTFYVR
jgi:hypothetical protein